MVQCGAVVGAGVFFTHTTLKIRFTGTVLFLATVWALASVRQSGSVTVQAGLAMFGGTLVAMVIVLFIGGPGNLWPIVIVIGTFVLAPAFVLGIAVSLLWHKFVDRPKGG